MCRVTFTTFVKDKLLQSLSFGGKNPRFGAAGFKSVESGNLMGGGINGCLLIVLCWGGMRHLRIAAGRNWRQQDGDTGVTRGWWQLQSLLHVWGQLCCSLKDQGWAPVGIRCRVSADLEAGDIHPSLWVRSKSFSLLQTNLSCCGVSSATALQGE